MITLGLRKSRVAETLAIYRVSSSDVYGNANSPLSGKNAAGRKERLAKQ